MCPIAGTMVTLWSVWDPFFSLESPAADHIKFKNELCRRSENLSWERIYQTKKFQFDILPLSIRVHCNYIIKLLLH